MPPARDDQSEATASVLRTLIWAAVVVVVLVLLWRFAEFQGWVGRF